MDEDRSRDRYEIRAGAGDQVFVADRLKQWPAGDYSEADPPIGGPMPRKLAEAIVDVANAAHRHRGGYLDSYFEHTSQAVRALQKLDGIQPLEPLELFREKPADLLELAQAAESLARALKYSAIYKRQMSTAIADLLRRAEGTAA